MAHLLAIWPGARGFTLRGCFDGRVKMLSKLVLKPQPRSKQAEVASFGGIAFVALRE